MSEGPRANGVSLCTDREKEYAMIAMLNEAMGRISELEIKVDELEDKIDGK